jgi:hypothetical protein
VKRWDDLRNTNPVESSEALSLAMIDSEKIYTEMLDIYRVTNGRSPLLKKQKLRVFITARCKGNKQYREVVEDHTMALWENHLEQERIMGAFKKTVSVMFR